MLVPPIEITWRARRGADGAPLAPMELFVKGHVSVLCEDHAHVGRMKFYLPPVFATGAEWEGERRAFRRAFRVAMERMSQRDASPDVAQWILNWLSAHA